MLPKWIPNFEICEVGILSRKIAKKTSLRTITKFMFSLKTHERTIDGNPSNFPSLIIKNKDHCNNSYENYESRIDFYTDQYEKKFKN